MDVRIKNELFSRGEIDHEGLWPHISEMEAHHIQFQFEFGLQALPAAPGFMSIRGPRQYGKSTWLEFNLRQTLRDHGKGSVYYLNGDEIASFEDLARQMSDLENAYSPDANLKRLFIDEITAIPSWEKGIKRLIDQGRFKDVLIVTTGSKATDLRRGTERLPGRKGKLSQSSFILLPVSYAQFRQKTSHILGPKTVLAYVLTGGSPLACNEIAHAGRLPEYFIQLTQDWIFGELIASGRSRLSLHNLLQVIFQYAGQPVGFAKLARESALANNTVAGGYIEHLSDLLCLLPSWPWDDGQKKLILRKPCKFHFVNLAAAISLHPLNIRSVANFEALTPEQQSPFLEWLVAQELWRRSVLRGDSNPEAIGFWQSKEHEIDFVTPHQHLIEVKRGRAGPLDFSWFSRTFPHRRLVVVCNQPFKAKNVTGMRLEDFLLEP